MDSAPIGSIALGVFTAALGSLFASGDAALTSLPDARLRALAAEHPRTFGRYADARSSVLSRWLVARILSISLSTALFLRVAEGVAGERWGALLAALGAVLSYGSFADVLGTLARRRPERIGGMALRVLKPIEWALTPLAEPLSVLGRWAGRHVPRAAVDARTTETEVELAVEAGEKSGTLSEEPAKMIRNLLDFKDRAVGEVMVPRRRISGIEIGTPLKQAMEIVATVGHSRYPVYAESLDNVQGLVYAKDLFDVVRKGQQDTRKLSEIVRKPILFVSESQRAESVLREMRAKRLHMAVVSDEFGGTAGLVTLEDIIEEIVGEIHDEHDTDADSQIQKIAEGRYVADAAIAIGDLEPHLGRTLPTEGNFESLGGLIVQRAGRVPEVGTQITLHGYRLIVREADETRVVKVEIVRAEPDLEPPAEAVS